MMYYLQVNFLVQILLVFTCQVQTSKAYESQRNSLKEQFQKALINDSEKLLTLQQVFLTPHPKNPNGQYLYVSVNVEGRISDKNEYDFYDYYDCTKYFPQNNLCVYNASMEFEISPPYQFSTVINFLNKAHDISLVLAVLDPSFFGLSRAFQYFDSFSSGYMLDIYVDEVEIMPEEIPTDVRDALYLTLSWAKAYTKSDGHLNFINLEDISWLMEIVKKDSPNSYMYYNSDYYSFSSSSVAALIFCTFVWLNILILILTVLYTEEIYVGINVEESRSNLKDLYKASAGVLTFINLAAVGGDLSAVAMFYSKLIYLYDDSTYIYSAYLTLKLFLVVLIMITDLVVSCLCTCKHNKRRLHQILHALALCQIIWFVHRLATEAIISAITFIIAPAQTLGTVTLLLSTVVCAILFVSSLLKEGQQCCSKAVFCTLLIAICTTGLIVTVTILFIALVDNGLQSAGMGGFILSLVPSTAIFVIGLCVNREIAVNFYHNVFASSSASGSANEEVNHAADARPVNVTVKNPVNATETTHLIQVDDNEEEH